jgi:hypothetical protein
MTPARRNDEIDRLVSQAQAIVTLMGNSHLEDMGDCDGYSPTLSLASQVVVDLIEQVRVLAVASCGEAEVTQ